MRSTFVRWCLALAVLAISMVVARRAQAIPAFARRYETSCQTCHLVPPKLNPFGEAFRRNGYRFPDGGDATAVKEEPIALGADANKDVWPHAVYPGELAGKLPIALTIDTKLAVGTHFEAGHTVTDAADHHATASGPTTNNLQAKFSEMTARLLAGGPIGKIASFYGAVSFGGHAAAEFERGAITLMPIDATTLHVKVGKFEPELHGVSIHRGIFGHQLRLTTMHVAINPFMPEPALMGMQASGVVAGRLGWFAGVMENAQPIEEVVRDFYGRSEIKLGGMRLDGVGWVGSAQPWRERSLILGFSGYRGRGHIKYTIPLFDHDETFVRAGIDAHVIFDDFLFDVVAVRQRHDAPDKLEGSPTNGSQVHTLDLLYAEATYVLFPWLMPSARFEYSKLAGPATATGMTMTGGTLMTGDPSWIGLFGISALIRPNVSTRVEVASGVDPGGSVGFRFAALSLSAGI